jgi:hypothetical protein
MLVSEGFDTFVFFSQFCTKDSGLQLSHWLGLNISGALLIIFYNNDQVYLRVKGTLQALNVFA